MTETQKTLESRLEKFTKQATIEKLVKIKRYRMMLCSVGLSVVVFATYSVVSPFSVREEPFYVMDNNQAVNLTSERTDFNITKTKQSKPLEVKNEKQKPLPKATSTMKLENTAPTSSKVVAQESSVPTSKPIETPEQQTPPAKTYPEWIANTTYQIGDRVIYNDKLYEANEPNSDSPPDQQHFLFGSSWDEVEE
ncbi:carbohydrate-binding protein [Shimazuella kribbensis]|uniref:carbohydrate-binding protein n=1 Tax=Shimazuella kribbensis TaxID=139808 RepID=UPI000410E1DA|nr:carbohydrate-binding protein [Shimazuella kribbensis]